MSDRIDFREVEDNEEKVEDVVDVQAPVGVLKFKILAIKK